MGVRYQVAAAVYRPGTEVRVRASGAPPAPPLVCVLAPHDIKIGGGRDAGSCGRLVILAATVPRLACNFANIYYQSRAANKGKVDMGVCATYETASLFPHKP